MEMLRFLFHAPKKHCNFDFYCDFLAILLRNLHRNLRFALCDLKRSAFCAIAIFWRYTFEWQRCALERKRHSGGQKRQTTLGWDNHQPVNQDEESLSRHLHTSLEQDHHKEVAASLFEDPELIRRHVCRTKLPPKNF